MQPPAEDESHFSPFSIAADQAMNTAHELDWRVLWRKLTIEFFMMIILITVTSSVTQYVSSKDALATYIAALSPLVLYVVAVSTVFSVFFALLISLSMRSHRVTFDDNYIVGRDMWGFKRRIPLNSIRSVSSIENNGLSGIILKSEGYGSISIPKQIERQTELLVNIREQITRNTAEQGAAANP